MKKTTKRITYITGIIALVTLSMHLINKLLFAINTMKELLISNDGSFYHWRFGKVFYTKKGSGKPILLVHDINGSSSHYEWKQLESSLSQLYTVYTLDLIGSGKSEKPKLTYTNYLYVQLISDFIKMIIKEPTDIITSGRSGAAAIMACYIDKQLFHNILMINPTDLKELNKYPHKKNKVLKWIIDIPILGTFIYNIRFSKTVIKKKLKSDYMYSSSKPIKHLVEAYSEGAHLSGASSKYLYSSIKCHYVNTNIIHAIKDINNSIFIIAGDNAANATNIVSDYQYYNPSIEVNYIKNTKLLPHVEFPEEVFKWIQLYLQ